MSEVALAVVSWNTRELLRACLTAAAREGADVWVVDNASDDGSAAMVEAEFPGVHLVASERNLGFGAAVNRVAQATSTPYLALANADTALTPGALAQLRATLAADPGAGAVAPRLELPDGSTQHSVYAFPTVTFSALFALGLAGDRLCVPGRWDARRARRVPWAIGAFLLVRREAWDAAGGFDEDQWLYAEDLELGWRLRRAGWATRYEPRATVLHADAAATTARWGEARRERWQRATYAWILRRRGVAALRATALVNVLGALARGSRAWAALHWRTGLTASRASLQELTGAASAPGRSRPGVPRRPWRRPPR